MINLGDKQNCICKKYNNHPSECKDKYRISEAGKSIELIPKNLDEKACAMVIDQCLVTDNKTKCDALFLFQSQHKKISFLTELKGVDIEKAFKQLVSFKKNINLKNGSMLRKTHEYKNIIQKFKDVDNKKVIEKYIIVSNGFIDKSKKEALEDEYQIRVRAILHSEATTPITNLRDYI